MTSRDSRFVLPQKPMRDKDTNLYLVRIFCLVGSIANGKLGDSIPRVLFTMGLSGESVLPLNAANMLLNIILEGPIGDSTEQKIWASVGGYCGNTIKIGLIFVNWIYQAVPLL